MSATIHRVVAADVYHGDEFQEGPTLNASVAWTLLHRSPAHAWTAHPRLNPAFEPKHSAPFDLGGAAHHMVLRQDYWREEIAVIDAADWRTKKAREERDAAREAGSYPLLTDQYDTLQRMVSVLEKHPQAGKAFTGGHPEVTIVWQDEETGVWCRCRPDYWPPSIDMVSERLLPWPDYKTTADARPGDWDRRFLLDHGGLFRIAWYREGIAAAIGQEPVQYFVVQEVAPPHEVIVRVVSGDNPILAIGRNMVRTALRRWAKCLDSGHWPGYEPLIGELHLPHWAEERYAVDYPAPPALPKRDIDQRVATEGLL